VQGLLEWMELTTRKVPIFLIVLSRGHFLTGESETLKLKLANLSQNEIEKFSKELPQNISPAEATREHIAEYDKMLAAVEKEKKLAKEGKLIEKVEYVPPVELDLHTTVAEVKYDHEELKQFVKEKQSDKSTENQTVESLSSNLESLIKSVEKQGETLKSNELNASVDTASTTDLSHADNITKSDVNINLPKDVEYVKK